MRITIRPGVWTRLPGTVLELLWESSGEVKVHCDGHFWHLGPLARFGSKTLVWIKHDRMSALWPLVPLTRRAHYRSATLPG